MSAFSYSRRQLKVVSLLAVLILILFSSWNNLPNHFLYRAKAGNAAYHLSLVNHRLQLNGQTLSYQSATGYLNINNQADIFYTAYTAKGNNRPITFVFNGGPGSASIWLHMGSFGPQRVNFKNDKGDTENAGTYAANPYTWLGFTDLVFIDPVSTGYSRTAEGIDAKAFNNYNADIQSIATFIKSYLSQQHRENSPKYLAGESYGAVRAIGLTDHLQQHDHITLDGLTLISPALNYQLINFNPGNETPYPYYLPSYAVAAQYHGKLSKNLQALTPAQLTQKVTAFAQGKYAQFLTQGDAATPVVINQVLDSLSYFTGLSKQTVAQLNGRITDRQFTQNLLQENSETIGTFDSRFNGKADHTDPSENNLRGAFTTAFQGYVSNQLKYNNNLPYTATTASSSWNYGPAAANQYLDVSGTLKKIMSANPNLKINIAAGYYDLATPAGSTDYVIHHLGLRPELKANINIHYYNSGHMIYISGSANKQFLADGEKFYQRTLTAIKS